MDKDYHQWRAQTARFLASSPKLRAHQPCIDHKIKLITKNISSNLKDYTDNKDIFGDNENNKGSDNLASIMRTAVALDLLLWQQKAFFSFRVCYPEDLQGSTRGQSLRFNVDWMTSDLTDRHDDCLMRTEQGDHIQYNYSLRQRFIKMAHLMETDMGMLLSFTRRWWIVWCHSNKLQVSDHCIHVVIECTPPSAYP